MNINKTDEIDYLKGKIAILEKQNQNLIELAKQLYKENGNNKINTFDQYLVNGSIIDFSASVYKNVNVVNQRFRYINIR